MENQQYQQQPQPTKNTFVMYGHHMFRASTIERVSCQLNYDTSAKQVSCDCTVYTDRNNIMTTFPSVYDALEETKKLMSVLNK